MERDKTLTDGQLDTLIMIAGKPFFWENHPKYRFKKDILDALEKKGLIEYYDGKEFPHDAVRITEEGKKQLREIVEKWNIKRVEKNTTRRESSSGTL